MIISLNKFKMTCIGKNPYPISEVWYEGILGMFRIKFFGNRKIKTDEEKLQNALRSEGIPYNVNDAISSVRRWLYTKQDKIIFDLLVDRKTQTLSNRTKIFNAFSKTLERI